MVHGNQVSHSCKKCDVKIAEDGSNFSTRIVNGRRYYRHLCRKCFNRETKRRQAKKGTTQRYVSRASERIKEERKSGKFTAKYILTDSRKSDRKRGLENDLDIKFVAEMIADPCAYCGSTSDPMSLDRIDNSVGHLKANVNPSCRRCNWIRRDMPFEAWQAFLPTLKFVREQGLFEGWHAGPNKAKQL